MRGDVAQLTTRELDVLRCVARGLSNPETGRELFVSEATMKSHVMRIFDMPGVKDRTAAVTKAIAGGYCRPHEPRRSRAMESCTVEVSVDRWIPTGVRACPEPPCTSWKWAGWISGWGRRAADTGPVLWAVGVRWMVDRRRPAGGSTTHRSGAGWAGVRMVFRRVW